jgi:hypothetical protein
MKRNLKWIAGGVVASLAIVAFAIPALAAGPSDAATAKTATVCQYGSGNCQGLGVGIDDSIAKLLGLTQAQIAEQRQAGKSLVQIAAAQNVSKETLVNAIMAEKQVELQNMVTAGTLTQAQADLRLAQMKERVQLAVERTTVGPPEWAGANSAGQGRGMMQQSRLTNQSCTGAGQMMRSGRGTR